MSFRSTKKPLKFPKRPRRLCEVVRVGIYLHPWAASGLSCSFRDLSFLRGPLCTHSLWLWTRAQYCGSLYSARTLSGSAHGLSRVAHRPQSSPASVVAASRLSCPTACGVLAPRPVSKPKTSALQGRFLTTGPPGWSPKAKWFTLNVDGCPEDPTWHRNTQANLSCMIKSTS